MTDLSPNDLSPQDVPNDSELSVGPARCHGSGSYEDGKWHWREGCDDCQRRFKWAGGWIDPPPIIAFECEYRIGPDKNAAQGEHAPVTEPPSPAAQAVFDAYAYLNVPCGASRRVWVAAAIRAVADQVASPIPDDCRCDVFNRQLDIRAAILAIATALENAQ